MPRVRIGPALPDRTAIDVEIARLRDLDIAGLRGRWHNVFGRRPPSHLPRYLLFRILAYRLQAATGSVTSMVRAGVCLIAPARLRRPARRLRL